MINTLSIFHELQESLDTQVTEKIAVEKLAKAKV